MRHLFLLLLFTTSSVIAASLEDLDFVIQFQAAED